MKCEICGKECNGLLGLSLHISKQHHNNREYYDTYIRKPDEGFCERCGKPTTFIGFGKGYTKLCEECERNDSKSSQCQICGQFCKNLQSLHTHIRLHKISDRDYYDTYLKKEGDGICPICNRPTRFYGLRGYRRYCSMSCASLSPDAQEKLRETSQRKYHTNSPNQAYIIKEKQKQSLVDKFGEDFGKERYKRATKTMQKKFGVANMLEIHEIQRKGVDLSHTEKADAKREKTYQDVYGVNHPYLRHMFWKYKDVFFDSRFELAVYIYCIDHNIEIEREPIVAQDSKGKDIRYFVYKDKSGHTRKYFPDFRIRDMIVETKSNYWVSQVIGTPKYDCMIKNGVEIWTDKELKPYFAYCEQKYGTRKWSDQFKYFRE